MALRGATRASGNRGTSSVHVLHASSCIKFNAASRNDTCAKALYFDFLFCLFLCSSFLGSLPQELALKVMEIELPPAVMVHLLDEMSNTEERLAHGASERLQLGSLVGTFATAR